LRDMHRDREICNYWTLILKVEAREGKIKMIIGKHGD